MRCNDCPFQSRFTGTRGPADAAVVIVGESPGSTEIRKGKPFMGQSGELLRKAMRKAGQSDPKIAERVKHFRLRVPFDTLPCRPLP